MVLTWDMIYLKAFCLLIVIVGNHEQNERTLFVNGLEMRDQNDEIFCDENVSCCFVGLVARLKWRGVTSSDVLMSYPEKYTSRGLYTTLYMYT